MVSPAAAPTATFVAIVALFIFIIALFVLAYFQISISQLQQIVNPTFPPIPDPNRQPVLPNPGAVTQAADDISRMRTYQTIAAVTAAIAILVTIIAGSVGVWAYYSPTTTTTVTSTKYEQMDPAVVVAEQL